LLTVQTWRFEEYAFTLYILLVTSIMFLPTGIKFVSSKLGYR
jgi:hypothetical protein